MKITKMDKTNIVIEFDNGFRLSFHTQTIAAARKPGVPMYRQLFSGVEGASRRVAELHMIDDRLAHPGPTKDLREYEMWWRGVLSSLPVSPTPAQQPGQLQVDGDLDAVARQYAAAASQKPGQFANTSGVTMLATPPKTSRWIAQWAVPSSSNPNKAYTVSVDRACRFECSCPAWTNSRAPRKECKHIEMVRQGAGLDQLGHVETKS